VGVESTRGVDTAATMRAAQADLAGGDAFAFERVEWLLRVGGTTSRWPTFVHPRLLTGSAGAGDDPAASAAFVALVRALVLDDSQPGRLRLLTLVPPTWFGQSLDVHDLPTAAGTLSFALRWHGARPALLWELAPHVANDGSATVTITAPGLDDSWTTDALQGEVLLAAPRTPLPVALVEHPSTDHVPMTMFEPRVRRESPADGSVVSPAPPEEPLSEPGESFG
jgi:hypothetical protein